MTLKGKAAIVTGSSRGIGAATAKALAREGARVVVNYRSSEDKAREVKGAIEATGGEALVIQADVSQRDEVDRMVAQAVSAFGKVDILVNNAFHSFVPKPFTDLEWDDFELQVEGTLKAAFNCCKAVLQGMIERKSGAIINISSTIIHRPWVGACPYTTVKTGIIGFTRSLASELGTEGIRANVVSPGWVSTEAVMAAIPPEFRQAVTDRTPLRGLTAPEDIAEAVVFLASDRARFITGAYLPVCGGDEMV